ncbi:hypothetical protein BKA63DRAFT_525341 [Paraphoma chrysanthemicola]|nr:hypothetical protein BKA63DRAFT_525341 [Paraphoma chrysanthemicola]
MGNQISQIFPPKPTFTESSLPDLKGKVYIVTGASAGVGKELARLLYSRNGTVYLAARNAEKTQSAIDWISQSHPSSSGALHFLKLDLNDLEGINPSVQDFLSKEKRLDVLFNNAGVMIPPKGSVTKQGHELQLGTNCLAPFLFTKLLTPLLVATAKASPAGSVRVVWVSSSAAHMIAPKNGVDMSNLEYKTDKSDMVKYGVSKGGNVLHAQEYRRRYGGEGVVSVSLNPGNLKTELARHASSLQEFLIQWMLYPAVNGAYTELYAGLAPEVKDLKESEWVVPFGRVMPLRKDYVGCKTAGEFWEWSERETQRYA